MAQTIIGVGNALAVQRYSAVLAAESTKASYFTSKFAGVGADSMTPIQIHQELSSDAGDRINYDISMQIDAEGVQSDDILEGSEVALNFYSSSIYIDQERIGINCGGAMTRKRTLHDLRSVALKRMADWWAKNFDAQYFCYLSGARGVNTDYPFSTAWTGRAGNTLTALDSNHLVYGGSATAKNDLDANDGITLGLIDKLVAKAKSMEDMPIQPCKVDGVEAFILIMSPYQEWALRSATGEASFLAVQKAAAGADGQANPLFKGALGMYGGVILHAHPRVVRFSDYGNPATVPAARALFLGAQAAVAAFGSGDAKQRYGWKETLDDRDNQLIITSNAIYGIRRNDFNSTAFGVIGVDTYNPAA